MPAYSFQERFVPMVLDGSKCQTIRTRRKKGFAKKGDRLFLYYGMRTKHCRKLREEICLAVDTVMITREGSIYVFNYRMDDEQASNQLAHYETAHFHFVTEHCDMKVHNKDQFAFKDGFRTDSKGMHPAEGSFDLMMRFWKQTHQLPFIGDLITWYPTPQKS